MSTVLVTGATGTIGSEVVRALRRSGVAVRAFARDPEAAASKLGPDVEIAAGAFEHPDTVDVALSDVDAVFLACRNDRRQFEYEANVIDAAARTGVARLVKLSARGAQPGSELAFWDTQGRIEKHLEAAALPSIVLQPTLYMSNLLTSADAVRHTGQLFLPAGDAAVAMVDPRDVAAVAAAVLTGAGEAGRRYQLTGPEALTFRSVAEHLATAVGYPVQYVAVPDDAARSAMVEAGMPGWTADNVVTLFRILRQGPPESTTDDVRQLAGGHPTPFAAFAHDHAHLFGR